MGKGFFSFTYEELEEIRKADKEIDEEMKEEYKATIKQEKLRQSKREWYQRQKAKQLIK